MRLKWSEPRRLRVLDFDCEARPLHWYGGDFVSKEITAIACKFIGERERVRVWLLGEDDPVDMLEGFRGLFDEADMVTGHFIRGYDLPVINGAMTEYGLPPLSSKLAHDTKLDLMKRSGLSGSQENLADMLGVPEPKVQMNQRKWREANRLTPHGLELTRRRVVGDVLQHVELRKRLIDLGYLDAPRVWRACGRPAPSYIA